MYKKYIKSGKVFKSYKFIFRFILLLLQSLQNVNINVFFLQIYKKMYCPVIFQKYIKSGRVKKIPIQLKKQREIFYYVGIIFNFIKMMHVTEFEQKLVMELLNIYKNNGLILKKQFEYKKLVQDSLPNRKLLLKI